MRRLFLLLLFAFSLNASTIRATYDIKFAIFGKIGEAALEFSTDDHFYHIRAEAGLTGTAARLGGNRREIHESFGTIEKGRLIASLYKKQRRSDRRHEDTYHVLYTDGSVETYQFRTKKREKSYFDTDSMSLKARAVEEQESSFTLMPFKSHDDLLSLFFNVRNLLKEIPPGSMESLTAAGAKNEKGEIFITNPAGKKRALLRSLMPVNEDRFVTVIVDQDIFESEKGELFINLDEQLLAQEAMLKDVLLFGDIRAERTSQQGTLDIH